MGRKQERKFKSKYVKPIETTTSQRNLISDDRETWERISRKLVFLQHDVEVVIGCLGFLRVFFIGCIDFMYGVEGLVPRKRTEGGL